MKTNLAELLKDCPTGMELDCTIFENLEFDYIDKNTKKYPIICRVKTKSGCYNIHTFTKYGCFTTEKYSKCSIFPKGKTTWEGFVPPCKFKDGDIITSVKESNPFIFHYDNGEFFDVHCALINDYLQIYKRKNNWVSNRRRFRYATEEEKQKLFDAIKANGYKWNAETKTLEKLIEPIFKVGDKIEKCGYRFTIKEVKEYHYLTKCGILIAIAYQDDFSLVPNKFDITTLNAFDKVLVRDYDNRMWIPTFWGKRLEDDSNCSYLTTNGCYKYCIPYEHNEHLCGTTNDCDDFYKTWVE